MSLAVTHRFNWMGYEGTESEALNIGLLRPGGESGSMRNADYNYRQEVTADIRLRLKLIKRDLGLLPPEDDDEDSHIDDEENNSLDSSDDEIDAASRHTRRSDPLNSTRGDMMKLAERRRRMLGNGRLGDSDDDEHEVVMLWPVPPTENEIKSAAAALGPMMRGVLSRRGEAFVSYVDGAEIISLEELRKHNAAARAAMEEIISGASIPNEGEFDTTALASLLENRNQIRMKLDAVRCRSDESYANKLPADELDNSGEPITNVNPEDGDENALLVKLNGAKTKFVTARTAYNRRAAASAKTIMTEFVNTERKTQEEEKPQEEEEEQQEEEVEVEEEAAAQEEQEKENEL